jgi:uncharacterized protein YndB with AHSA1/START domain
METKATITVETVVNAPAEKVWQCWVEPQHITRWCQASDDWHAPHAENDVRVGGQFKTTMAAKDGSFSFDFGGEYTKVEPQQAISYTLGDGRKVDIQFKETGNGTEIIETFDPESTHSAEMQQQGWQAILNNFKKYVEAQ